MTKLLSPQWCLMFYLFHSCRVFSVVCCAIVFSPHVRCKYKVMPNALSSGLFLASKWFFFDNCSNVLASAFVTAIHIYSDLLSGYTSISMGVQDLFYCLGSCMLTANVYSEKKYISNAVDFKKAVYSELSTAM